MSGANDNYLATTTAGEVSTHIIRLKEQQIMCDHGFVRTAENGAINGNVTSLPIS